ncbi:MAG: UDP-2,4-diacetamido-2,4,6-trideoxy-beta-L-altropyranose hydrolase, partial [Desulfocucumaceae bacterium]
FVCRDLPGNLCRLVEEKKHRVFRLPRVSEEYQGGDGPRHDYMRWLGVSPETDAGETIELLIKESRPDWLVVDHYALDSRWESEIRPYTRNIMVIDDLADRLHDCDMLLDQNLYRDMETRYTGLVPDYCRMLLGPGHALLRPEFREARKHLKERNGNVRSILVFFGGSDPTNETAKALEAIRRLKRPDINVDVVVGGANPNKVEVKQICSGMPNTRFHFQVDNMAELMAKADLAIGAGGTTTWERCFLGLPAIVIVIAQNQYETTAAVADAGALQLLGWSHEANEENIKESIERAIENQCDLRKMEKNALKLMVNYSFVTHYLN